MLSGNRAFRGDSAGETMAAILKEDPPDLSVTNQNITPGLERIVRHCLEKNPERRFQSASDIAFDLEAVSGDSVPRPVPSLSAARWRRPVLLAAAAVAVALLAGLLAGRQIWRTPAGSSPTFHRLTYRRGYVRSARFAPDGHTVFFAANWDGVEKPQLFTTRLDNPGSLLLDLPSGYVESISRSGEMLILSDDPDQKVALYPVDGGSPLPVEGLDPNDQPLRWSEDQRFLFVSHDLRQIVTARICRVELATGRRELWKEFSLRDPTGTSRISGSAITPDGKTFVFSYAQRLSDLYVVDGLR